MVKNWMRTGLMIAACAAGLQAPVRAQVISQDIGMRSLLITGDRKVYVVDFASGTASLIPIQYDNSTSLYLSPNADYLASVSGSMISIYQLTASNAALAAQIPVTAKVTNVHWSSDDRNLAFVQEVANPDGTVTPNIYMWTVGSTQSKKIL